MSDDTNKNQSVQVSVDAMARIAHALKDLPADDVRRIIAWAADAYCDCEIKPRVKS